MPCRDYGHEDDMLERLNKVTALLCATMRRIENQDEANRVDTLTADLRKVKGLYAWWNEHKKEDERQAALKRQREREARIEKENALKELALELGFNVVRSRKGQDTGAHRGTKYDDPDDGDRITALYEGKRLSGVVKRRLPMKGIYPYDVGWQVLFKGMKGDVRINRDAKIRIVS